MGREAALRAELAGLEADIRTLGDAIRVYEPDAKLAGIKPGRQREHLFRRGEVARHVLTVLREKGTASIREIVDAIKARTGIEKDLTRHVDRCLANQARSGRVEVCGHNDLGRHVWRIAPRPQAATARPEAPLQLARRP